MPKISLHALALFLLAAAWSAWARKESGASFALEGECLAGYHGNPRYLPPGNALAEASALLQAEASGKWKYAGTERWELRANLDGSSRLHPSAREGDIHEAGFDSEVRYHYLGSRPAGKTGESSFLGLAYKTQGSDNSILSNPDRSDPDAPNLSLVENRIRLVAQCHLAAAGAFRVETAAGHNDYGESAGLLASLDSHEERAVAAWISPGFGAAEAELGYGLGVRNYFKYPARDILGDTVSRITKRLFTHGPRAKLRFDLGRRMDFYLEYALEVQRDAYQGYFDCVSHSPGFWVKAVPAKGWEVALRGWMTWDLYDSYHVAYNPDRPLKRIRYDFIRARVERGFGRFFGEMVVLYRAEENNSPAYRYRAPSAGIGWGVKL